MEAAPITISRVSSGLPSTQCPSGQASAATTAASSTDMPISSAMPRHITALAAALLPCASSRAISRVTARSTPSRPKPAASVTSPKTI